MKSIKNSNKKYFLIVQVPLLKWKLYKRTWPHVKFVTNITTCINKFMNGLILTLTISAAQPPKNKPKLPRTFSFNWTATVTFFLNKSRLLGGRIGRVVLLHPMRHRLGRSICGRHLPSLRLCRCQGGSVRCLRETLESRGTQRAQMHGLQDHPCDKVFQPHLYWPEQDPAHAGRMGEPHLQPLELQFNPSHASLA